MRLSLFALTILCSTSPAIAQYEATLIADINPGPEYSIQPSSWDTDYFSPAVYDGRLFFSADDGIHGRELWVYNADTDETTLVADINPGVGGSWPRHLILYDGRLFFEAATDQVERTLWVYDAASDNVTLATGMDTDPPRYLDFPVVYNDKLFFNASDIEHGYELWAYDAVTGEANLAADVSPGASTSYPTHLIVYDNRLFFTAEEGKYGRELWVYDAVTGEASLAADISEGPSSALSDDLGEAPVVYDERLFVFAERFDFGLWAYDASTDETSLVVEEGSLYLTNYDDKLFFESGFYDAATGERSVVLFGEYLTTYDGKLFYNRRSAGLELYDAATGEMSRVAEDDIGDDSYSQGFIVYAGRLFFNAWDEAHGRELWALSPASVSNDPSVSAQPERLHAPYPNPADGQATITFNLTEAGSARVEVFDVLGRRVAMLADGPVAAGEHTVAWKAVGMPSGVYLVRLTAGDAVQTQRLTLAR